MTASAAINSGVRATFVAIKPCRLVDTRPATHVGPRTSPLGPGEVYTLQVTGSNGKCVIPAGASAVTINLTVSNGTAASRLTAFNAAATRPATADLNWNPGATVQNSVDVGLSAAGALKLYNAAGTAHVRADVTGYFMDHNHDDRYYTKAQTNAAIAKDDEEVVAVANSGGTFTPSPAQVTLGSTTFTTTKSGRLHITMHVNGAVICATTNSFDAWIAVDDVPVMNSHRVLFEPPVGAGFDSDGFGPITMEGLTAAPVAAGTHTVKVNLACNSGSASAGSNVNFTHTGFVTVIP